MELLFFLHFQLNFFVKDILLSVQQGYVSSVFRADNQDVIIKHNSYMIWSSETILYLQGSSQAYAITGVSANRLFLGCIAEN